MYQQMVLRMININDTACTANGKKWRFALSMMRLAICQGNYHYIPMLWRALRRISKIKQEAKNNRILQEKVDSHWI